MASKTVTDSPDLEGIDGSSGPHREWAPSQMRAEEPRFARWMGMIGLMLVVLGTLTLLMRLWYGRANALFGVGYGSVFLELGLVGMLFHAMVDKDLQVRRSYAVFGFISLAVGAVMCLVPLQGVMGAMFGPGVLFLTLPLFFIAAAAHHETEHNWRHLLTGVLGFTGLALALVGFVGSNIGAGDFLLPRGLLLAILGLGYLWSYVSLRGTGDDTGYRAGLGMGLLGALVFLIALGRSTLPPLFHSWHWVSSLPAPYFKPIGFVLMLLGAMYFLAAAAICSDRPLMVMTRRELVAFFYSPVAYIVLFGLTVVAGFFFAQFVGNILDRSDRSPVIEPIIRQYMFGLFPVICLVFIVPVLTMRLLSEEQRTGTLEVLLTAPVNETAIVLSKFFASLIFFLLAWAPWGLLLIALRIEGGQPFDYRPLFSFFIALAFMGAGFMAMGLFFSSLTRNQIASAILTFTGMLLITGISVVKWSVERQSPGAGWATVLGHVSYLDLWWESMGGSLIPRTLIFYLSMAILWLFMSVKVLEIRRWS